MRVYANKAACFISARIAHHCFKLSSRASFKRVPQNCGDLTIQHFKTAAKLQLFVRYDALNCDLNDNSQHVTDECCCQNRGDQRSKVRSHVGQPIRPADDGRHPDDDLEKCFHLKCSRRSPCRPLAHCPVADSIDAMVSTRYNQFSGTQFPQLRQHSAGTIWARADRSDCGSALARRTISGCVFCGRSRPVGWVDASQPEHPEDGYRRVLEVARRTVSAIRLRDSARRQVLLDQTSDRLRPSARRTELKGIAQSIMTDRLAAIGVNSRRRPRLGRPLYGSTHPTRHFPMQHMSSGVRAEVVHRPARSILRSLRRASDPGSSSRPAVIAAMQFPDARKPTREVRGRLRRAPSTA